MLPSLQESVAIFIQERNHSKSSYAARRKAIRQFRQAYSQGLANRFWSKLTGRDYHLGNLSERLKDVDVKSQHFAGTRTVQIDQILGSEGRSEDFDADFHPLNPHNEERWIGIATAQQLEVEFPPVDLIQLGDTYYVRDGHHRISVAKYLGQIEINAQVIVFIESPPAAAAGWASHPPERIGEGPG
jgi:hypothetical protein